MSSAPNRRSLSYWLKHRHPRKRRRSVNNERTPHSLDDVLDLLDTVSRVEQRSRCPISTAQWQEAVGIRIADRSSPRRLDHDGTLLIAVTSSVWAQELSMLSSTVCQRLQSHGHCVRTVRFVVAAVEPARWAPERFDRRYVPAPQPIPHDIVQSIEAIDDEQLRETMTRVIAASLAAQHRS